MRNLNEPHRDESISTADIAGRNAPQAEAEIVRFGRRDARSEASESLLPKDEVEQLHERWKAIQTDFVDEPRKSVEEADTLVASAIQRIAEIFAERRSSLEGQWSRGDGVSTEELRVSLQHYRAFFSRLLSI